MFRSVKKMQRHVEELMAFIRQNAGKNDENVITRYKEVAVAPFFREAISHNPKILEECLLLVMAALINVPDKELNPYHIFNNLLSELNADRIRKASKVLLPLLKKKAEDEHSLSMVFKKIPPLKLKDIKNSMNQVILLLEKKEVVKACQLLSALSESKDFHEINEKTIQQLLNKLIFIYSNIETGNIDIIFRMIDTAINLLERNEKVSKSAASFESLKAFNFLYIIRGHLHLAYGRIELARKDETLAKMFEPRGEAEVKEIKSTISSNEIGELPLEEGLQQTLTRMDVLKENKEEKTSEYIDSYFILAQLYAELDKTKLAEVNISLFIEHYSALQKELSKGLSKAKSQQVLGEALYFRMELQDRLRNEIVKKNSSHFSSNDYFNDPSFLLCAEEIVKDYEKFLLLTSIADASLLRRAEVAAINALNNIITIFFSPHNKSEEISISILRLEKIHAWAKRIPLADEVNEKIFSALASSYCLAGDHKNEINFRTNLIHLLSNKDNKKTALHLLKRGLAYLAIDNTVLALNDFIHIIKNKWQENVKGELRATCAAIFDTLNKLGESGKNNRQLLGLADVVEKLAIFAPLEEGDKAHLYYLRAVTYQRLKKLSLALEASQEAAKGNHVMAKELYNELQHSMASEQQQQMEKQKIEAEELIRVQENLNKKIKNFNEKATRWLEEKNPTLQVGHELKKELTSLFIDISVEQKSSLNPIKKQVLKKITFLQDSRKAAKISKEKKEEKGQLLKSIEKHKIEQGELEKLEQVEVDLFNQTIWELKGAIDDALTSNRNVPDKLLLDLENTKKEILALIEEIKQKRKKSSEIIKKLEALLIEIRKIDNLITKTYGDRDLKSIQEELQYNKQTITLILSNAEKKLSSLSLDIAQSDLTKVSDFKNYQEKRTKLKTILQETNINADDAYYVSQEAHNLDDKVLENRAAKLRTDAHILVRKAQANLNAFMQIHKKPVLKKLAHLPEKHRLLTPTSTLFAPELTPIFGKQLFQRYFSEVIFPPSSPKNVETAPEIDKGKRFVSHFEWFICILDALDELGITLYMRCSALPILMSLNKRPQLHWDKPLPPLKDVDFYIPYSLKLTSKRVTQAVDILKKLGFKIKNDNKNYVGLICERIDTKDGVQQYEISIERTRHSNTINPSKLKRQELVVSKSLLAGEEEKALIVPIADYFAKLIDKNNELKKIITTGIFDIDIPSLTEPRLQKFICRSIKDSEFSANILGIVKLSEDAQKVLSDPQSIYEFLNARHKNLLLRGSFYWEMMAIIKEGFLNSLTGQIALRTFLSIILKAHLIRNQENIPLSQQEAVVVDMVLFFNVFFAKIEEIPADVLGAKFYYAIDFCMTHLNVFAPTIKFREHSFIDLPTPLILFKKLSLNSVKLTALQSQYIVEFNGYLSEKFGLTVSSSPLVINQSLQLAEPPLPAPVIAKSNKTISINSLSSSSQTTAPRSPKIFKPSEYLSALRPSATTGEPLLRNGPQPGSSGSAQRFFVTTPPTFGCGAPLGFAVPPPKLHAPIKSVQAIKSLPFQCYEVKLSINCPAISKMQPQEVYLYLNEHRSLEYAVLDGKQNIIKKGKIPSEMKEYTLQHYIHFITREIQQRKTCRLTGAAKPAVLEFVGQDLGIFAPIKSSTPRSHFNYGRGGGI